MFLFRAETSKNLTNTNTKVEGLNTILFGKKTLNFVAIISSFHREMFNYRYYPNFGKNYEGLDRHQDQTRGYEYGLEK